MPLIWSKTRLSKNIGYYTLDGAFAEFVEDFKRSIEVGKAADFTVYDKDIMEIPENDILNASVEMAVVGGKIVFSRQ